MLSEEEKKAIEELDKLTIGKIIDTNEIDEASNIIHDKIAILNLIEKQQAQIEKKDKIIDAMAEELFIEIEPHFDTVEQCREYYTKLVEEETNESKNNN